MKKAHAYFRVSGNGRVEGDGFTRHLKAIRESAAAYDIKVVNVYRGEGVNGTKESACWSKLLTAVRPQFPSRKQATIWAATHESIRRIISPTAKGRQGSVIRAYNPKTCASM
jgi:hypothetical protein